MVEDGGGGMVECGGCVVCEVTSSRMKSRVLLS